MRPWGHVNIGEWSVQWSLSGIPLPSIRWYWHDEGEGSLAVAFGDENGDPIVALDSPTLTPPTWLGNLLDRIS